MKIKYIVLTVAIVVLCLVGCNKNNGQSSSESTPSSESTSIPYVKDPKISLNQSSVTFCVGEKFTLTANADGIENPTFLWTIDGDFDNGTVEFSQTGNEAVITAKKVGQTKLVAILTVGDNEYFKSVEVFVTEKSDVVLVLSDNIGFSNDGYYVKLSTLTSGDEQISVLPTVTAYKNNKTATYSDLSWVSGNPDVVSVSGNKFTSVSEGKTTVVGSLKIDGQTYSVEVEVEVTRPTIVLDEKFVVELEDLKTLDINSSIKGIAKDVLYNGQSVGSFDTQSKKVTLRKADLPKTATLMGEGRTLTIATTLANYEVEIDLYTKIIKNRDDFNNFTTVDNYAKRSSSNPAIWDGYFVLENDIIYDGQFISKIADLDSLWQAVEGEWFNGGLYGFRGVFDGKGHKIEGISIEKGSQMASVFGVLHIDGVIKNISFTKASVSANSSLVCMAGGGTVENIFIQYDSIGKGVQHIEGDGVTVNNHCGSFFSFKEPIATANVSNCVIDISSAEINENVSLKIVGSEYVTIKNTFVIGGTESVRKTSNATLSFSHVVDFVGDTNAQSRYKKFDEEFWSLEGGVPVSKTVYNEIKDLDVNFTTDIQMLISGTQYKFPVDNNYVLITSNSDKLKIESGIATVFEDVSGEVTVTATSLFNGKKTDTHTFTLKTVSASEFVDLTTEDTTAYYDISEDKVYFAELSSKFSDTVLYFVDGEFNASSFAKDGEEAKIMIAVCENSFVAFRCQSVTKVIAKAEDLHYIRRNYTVISYGNSGCYDGKLKGTYVLVNDIDCMGEVFADSGKYWENSRGFGGVFDGRGYTIKNLTVGKNGLFGTLSFAQIKNVKFTGVKLQGETAKDENGNEIEKGTYVGLLASCIFNTTVEDVYVEFEKTVYSEQLIGDCSGLLYYEKSFDSTFKNVTLDVSKVSVGYIAENHYDEVAYLSNEKSKFIDVTVILNSFDEIPVFAYHSPYGGKAGENIVERPDGIVIKDTNGNVYTGEGND